MLLSSFEKEELKNMSALFLTNETKTCALLNQRASGEEDYIIWDYHTILHNKKTNTILDFDTKLGFENPILFYFQNTFGQQQLISKKYRTLIIDIPGNEYLEHFYSDRTHMLDTEGNQVQPFPSWPLIKNQPPLKITDLMNLSDSISKIYKIQGTNNYLRNFL